MIAKRFLNSDSDSLGLGPVVATALLLVVAVISTVGFQNWFMEYSTKINADVEVQSNAGGDIQVRDIVGETLYISSDNNVTVDSIKIDGIDCNFNGSVSQLTQVNLSNCLNNISVGSANIVILTPDKIIENTQYVETSILSQIPIPSFSLFYVLDNSNNYSTSADDYFGSSVSIYGNYALAAAPAEDDVGGSGSGKAYIFNVSDGSLLHVLDNPNNYSTSAGDNFGISVSISGNYALIGANEEDDAGGAEGRGELSFTISILISWIVRLFSLLELEQTNNHRCYNK